MFRSPNDISSSESESSSDSDAAEASQENYESDIEGEIGHSLESQDSATESIPERGEWSLSQSDQQSNVPISTEEHSNHITASLLEFYYHTRATELLNAADPTANYDRDSPEAKALGRNMFIQNSTILANHGLIPQALHSDESKAVRQQYLAGLENLSIQNLKEDGGLPSSSQASQEPHEIQNSSVQMSQPRLGSLQDTALRPAPIISNVEIGPVQNAMPRSTGSGLTLFDKNRNSNSSLINNATVPSPRLDVRLSLRQSPSTALGRYSADFAEVKAIGRGGFGTVFHVVNFVDSQHYAVKKIPLSPKRLKRWQEGGFQEMENILKEIRTLARLEHCNVVRYYAAWIEGGEMSAPAATAPAAVATRSARSPMRRRLLGHTLAAATREGSSSADQRRSLPIVDAGVVFGEDSEPQTSIQPPIQAIKHDDASTSNVSFSDSDIFTDGDGRGRSSMGISDQSAVNLHIQMSLHPLSLSNYLSTSAGSHSPQRSAPSRHCFHVLPSLRILLGILSGVQYLHGQGIIHRDLKPGNVFLSESHSSTTGFVDVCCNRCPKSKSPHSLRYLNPRIGDFGLVASIAEVGTGTGNTTTNIHSPTKPSSSSTPLRQTFKPVGTELYRPPRPPSPPASISTTATATNATTVTGTPNTTSLDQPNPVEKINTTTTIDEKLDVFALGILLFELLWPFDTKMERHILLNDLSTRAKLPADFVDKLNDEGNPNYYYKNNNNNQNNNANRCDDHDDTGRSGGGGDGSHLPNNTVGDRLAICICAMVQGDARRRWDCARVREFVEEVVEMCCFG